MDVSRSNFEDVLKHFKSQIKTAAFCSVDLEMTGISHPDFSITPLDSPEQRYSVMSTIASQFNIIQLGICLAHFNPKFNPSLPTNPRTNPQYILTPINMHLFPKSTEPSGPLLTMCASAIQFNRRHGVNFHDWIAHGLPYINQQTEESLFQKIADDISYDKSFLTFSAQPRKPDLFADDKIPYLEKCVTHASIWVDTAIRYLTFSQSSTNNWFEVGKPYDSVGETKNQRAQSAFFTGLFEEWEKTQGDVKSPLSILLGPPPSNPADGILSNPFAMHDGDLLEEADRPPFTLFSDATRHTSRLVAQFIEAKYNNFQNVTVNSHIIKCHEHNPTFSIVDSTTTSPGRPTRYASQSIDLKQSIRETHYANRRHKSSFIVRALRGADGYFMIKIFTPTQYQQYVNDRQKVLENRAQLQIGGRHFWKAMIESNIPLVGHNLAYDLMFLYHAFQAHLPPTYREYCQAITSAFPGGIYDTKHIFTSFQRHPQLSNYIPYYQDDSDCGKSTRTHLESLHRVLTTTYSSMIRKFSPVPTWFTTNLINGRSFNRYYPGENQKFHEAGFDAYITMSVFLNCLQLLHCANKDVCPHKIRPKMDQQFHQQLTTVPYQSQSQIIPNFSSLPSSEQQAILLKRRIDSKTALAYTIQPYTNHLHALRALYTYNFNDYDKNHGISPIIQHAPTSNDKSNSIRSVPSKYRDLFTLSTSYNAQSLSAIYHSIPYNAKTMVDSTFIIIDTSQIKQQISSTIRPSNAIGTGNDEDLPADVEIVTKATPDMLRELRAKLKLDENSDLSSIKPFPGVYTVSFELPTRIGAFRRFVTHNASLFLRTLVTGRPTFDSRFLTPPNAKTTENTPLELPKANTKLDADSDTESSSFEEAISDAMQITNFMDRFNLDTSSLNITNDGTPTPRFLLLHPYDYFEMCDALLLAAKKPGSSYPTNAMLSSDSQSHHTTQSKGLQYYTHDGASHTTLKTTLHDLVNAASLQCYTDATTNALSVHQRLHTESSKPSHAPFRPFLLHRADTILKIAKSRAVHHLQQVQLQNNVSTIDAMSINESAVRHQQHGGKQTDLEQQLVEQQQYIRLLQQKLSQVTGQSVDDLMRNVSYTSTGDDHLHPPPSSSSSFSAADDHGDAQKPSVFRTGSLFSRAKSFLVSHRDTNEQQPSGMTTTATTTTTASSATQSINQANGKSISSPTKTSTRTLMTTTRSGLGAFRSKHIPSRMVVVSRTSHYSTTCVSQDHLLLLTTTTLSKDGQRSRTMQPTSQASPSRVHSILQDRSKQCSGVPTRMYMGPSPRSDHQMKPHLALSNAVGMTQRMAQPATTYQRGLAASRQGTATTSSSRLR